MANPYKVPKEIPDPREAGGIPTNELESTMVDDGQYVRVWQEVDTAPVDCFLCGMRAELSTFLLITYNTIKMPTAATRRVYRSCASCGWAYEVDVS